MNVSEFDFDLPESQIAQEPRPRGASRLLVVDRRAASWEEAAVADLPRWLKAGDLVVANDTRVFPARLIGRRDPSGGAVECLLLERVDDQQWHALVHPGQKLKPGARMRFDDPARAPGVALAAEIVRREFFGRRLVRFDVEGTESLDAAVDALGHVPLPPYIHRPDSSADRERYQTIYARERGSVAAPTAGLHFDQSMLDRLDANGIARTLVTHHVGYGTFKPVRVDRIEDHVVDSERYAIPAGAAAAVTRAREVGGRVLAIGTTTTRALESAADGSGRIRVGAATTDLFIYPGHAFTRGRCALHEFPPAAVVAAHAGRRLRRPRLDSGGVS